ncbi:MAG TPA: GerMN domain-containing protein [Clostridiales bacterium]|nr:GerMN domain-containing protein [Clostridiales bacterium]
MSYKKYMVYLILCLMLITTMTGCVLSKKNDKTDSDVDMSDLTNMKNGDELMMHGDEEDEEIDIEIRETLLYYQDDNGYLVPVVRKIPWEEGIAKAALNMMKDTQEQQMDFMAMGLKPVLPATAKINGLSIQNGLAKLDLSKEVMKLDNAVEENNMVQGIVMTLCEFPAIERVQFLFDGEIIDSLKYGTDVSRPLEPQNLNLELGTTDRIDGGVVTVFYHNRTSSQYSYLVPITRIIAHDSPTLEKAIEELIKGPKPESGLDFDIPLGTKLLGVQIEDGIASINFSSEFKNLSSYSNNEEIVIRAICMTAKQFPTVEKVNILVEGENYTPEGVTVSTFVNEY